MEILPREPTRALDIPVRSRAVLVVRQSTAALVNLSMMTTKMLLLPASLEEETTPGMSPRAPIVLATVLLAVEIVMAQIVMEDPVMEVMASVATVMVELVSRAATVLEALFRVTVSAVLPVLDMARAMEEVVAVVWRLVATLDHV